jgi:hypothetical protein
MLESFASKSSGYVGSYTSITSSSSRMMLVFVVIVVVVVGQAVVAACFAFFVVVHVVVAVVTVIIAGGGVEVPISIIFVSSLHFLGHVHTVFTYMSYKQFLLPAQVITLLLWAVSAVVAWLPTVETVVLQVLSFVSI